jgi:RNA polymerase sigma factor (sigma-70 family)
VRWDGEPHVPGGPSVYDAMPRDRPPPGLKPPFEVVVARHGATVLRVCRAVVGAADAEDAWSETFLSALRAYPALPADANLEAWLVTIAHRRALDSVRATQRRARPVDAVPEAGAGRGGDGADAARPDDDLSAALADLPPKQRQAVAYHYLADLPYAEVAAIVGGTPEAARRAAADGVARLRRTLPDLATAGAAAATQGAAR